MENIKSSFGGIMKTNIGKISMITFGIISSGLLIIGAFGLLIWRNAGLLPHGMYQSHSIMYNGTNPWGILIAIGVVLLIVIGAISLIKNTSDQNTSEIPLCSMCAEELVNPDWEFCPFCGAPAGK
ncbi:MAG: hypothetical protein A2029_02350 [Chloroflexi bacterium RBG_19FT_COMBO_47_9]|jgi:hypothetical protein|nr:MAG: hypothetical protein A2029_02350 [Chloroflexi bacterium RBG_19FT_COMBO_47_9]